jgi:hypothetical protein
MRRKPIDFFAINSPKPLTFDRNALLGHEKTQKETNPMEIALAKYINQTTRKKFNSKKKKVNNVLKVYACFAFKALTSANTMMV